MTSAPCARSAGTVALIAEASSLNVSVFTIAGTTSSGTLRSTAPMKPTFSVRPFPRLNVFSAEGVNRGFPVLVSVTFAARYLKRAPVNA